jgi:hypothetical protein
VEQHGGTGRRDSKEEHARYDVRKPGQQHRTDCLYVRRGPVQDGDWRLSRLIEALRQQEEA